MFMYLTFSSIGNTVTCSVLRDVSRTSTYPMNYFWYLSLLILVCFGALSLVYFDPHHQFDDVVPFVTDRLLCILMVGIHTIRTFDCVVDDYGMKSYLDGLFFFQPYLYTSDGHDQ